MSRISIDLQPAKNYNEAVVENALLQILSDVADNDLTAVVELLERVELALLEGFIHEETLSQIKGEYNEH